MNPSVLIDALRGAAARLENAMKAELPAIGNLTEAYQLLASVDEYWTLQLNLNHSSNGKIKAEWRAYSNKAKWSEDLKTLQQAVQHVLDGEKPEEAPQEPAAVIAAVQEAIEPPVPF